MERTKFWTRVGGWLRVTDRAAEFDDTIPDDLSGDPAADPGVLPAPLPAARDGEFNPPARHRLARREATIERLEEGYSKVLGLVESIDQHLKQQDERAESVTRSLDRIADTLGRWQEGSDAQTKLLAAISAELETGGARSKRLEEQLSQLPQIADAQREAMASISRQLDRSDETSEHVSTALQGFRQSVSGLGEAVSVSTTAINDARGQTVASEERLRKLYEEQTRRFTFFSCVAIGVAVVVAVMGLVALLR